jgi:hypothetical protein
MGTPSYMAPEQMLGRTHEVDGRSDVYSIGVLLYELLTGTLPYKLDRRRPLESLKIVRDHVPRPPSAMNARLDADIDSIVLKCLSKEREGRYQCAEDLSADLDRYMRGEPVQARSPSTLYHVRRMLWRRRSALALLAACSLVMVALGASMWWKLSNGQRQARATIAVAGERAGRSEADVNALLSFAARNGDMRERIRELISQGDYGAAYRIASLAEPRLPEGAGLRGITAEVRRAAEAAGKQWLSGAAVLAERSEFEAARALLTRAEELAGDVGLPELQAEALRLRAKLPPDLGEGAGGRPGEEPGPSASPRSGPDSPSGPVPGAR